MTFMEGHKNNDICFLPFPGDANRQISEYKFKLSKAEQEMGTMEQNVSSEAS